MAFIKSILDTDLYKFSMSYAYMKLFPQAEGVFEFNDRNKTVYTQEFIERLKAQVEELAELSLSTSEYDWARKTISYIPEFYWEWLHGFRFNPSVVDINLDKDGHLSVKIQDLIYRSTLYEVPLLAMISELKNKLDNNVVDDMMMSRLEEKVSLSNSSELLFSEFGTRRRYSFDVQDKVVSYLKDNAKYCSGTSNVYLAYKYGMKPIGTVAHEFTMFHGAQFGYRMANYLACENWSSVYGGDLGIALTDTYTSKVFFNNFTKKQAKLWDGVRQDSGDELEYVDMAISRYKELGVDPKSKTIVFSNALDMPKYRKIAEYCNGKIKCAAGIGTNLTNDTGNKPSNIVIKLMSCRMNSKQEWRSCIKVSDDLGKHMGNDKEFEICKDTLEL